MLRWSDFVRRDAKGRVVVDSRESDMRLAPGEAVWSDRLVPLSVENVGAVELRIVRWR